MTITSETARASHSGDGTTTTFAYNFQIEDESELQVILVAALSLDETVQVLNREYTVTGVGSGSGTVVFTTPPTIFQTIVILRSVTLVQEFDFENQKGFFPETHEKSLDRVVTVFQELQERVNRTILQSVTQSTTQRPDEIELVDGSVTTAKFADDAVTGGKIEAGAVDASKISSNAVGSTQLANDSVTTAKLNGADYVTLEAAAFANTSNVLSNNIGFSSVLYSTNAAPNGYTVHTFTFTFSTVQANTNYHVNAYILGTVSHTGVAPADISKNTSTVVINLFSRDNAGSTDDNGFHGDNDFSQIAVAVMRPQTT